MTALCLEVEAPDPRGMGRRLTVPVQVVLAPRVEGGASVHVCLACACGEGPGSLEHCPKTGLIGTVVEAAMTTSAGRITVQRARAPTGGAAGDWTDQRRAIAALVSMWPGREMLLAEAARRAVR